MFTRLLNDLQVTLDLQPRSPLLIKEGRHDKRAGRSFHPTLRRTPPRADRQGQSLDYDSADGGFDMACVWTHTAHGPRLYLPGSSLRGVVRSAAERLVGRWRPGLAAAADPFRTPQSHSDLDADPPAPVTVWAGAGPIERCFGSMGLRGHWTVADAWSLPTPEPQAVVRDGVGISRSTGAAQDALKFTFEALVSGTFRTTIRLINYELWQLGLLAHVLASLDSGMLRLGYGTTRGLGHVRVVVRELRWRWLRPPVVHNDRVSIPPLGTLIRQLPGAPAFLTTASTYDEHLSLALPLQPLQDTAAIGSLWTLVPTTTGQPGDEVMQWTDPLWGQLGRLLAPGLQAWPGEEVVV